MANRFLDITIEIISTTWYVDKKRENTFGICETFKGVAIAEFFNLLHVPSFHSQINLFPI